MKEIRIRDIWQQLVRVQDWWKFPLSGKHIGTKGASELNLLTKECTEKYVQLLYFEKYVQNSAIVYISWISFRLYYFFGHVYITPILCIHVLLSHENMCSPKFYNTEIYTLPWVNISCTHTRPKQIIVYPVHIQGLSTYTPQSRSLPGHSAAPYLFITSKIWYYLGSWILFLL
jgi:hypothetical protein